MCLTIYFRKFESTSLIWSNSMVLKTRTGLLCSALVYAICLFLAYREVDSNRGIFSTWGSIETPTTGSNMIFPTKRGKISFHIPFYKIHKLKIKLFQDMKSQSISSHFRSSNWQPPESGSRSWMVRQGDARLYCILYKATLQAALQIQ